MDNQMDNLTDNQMDNLTDHWTNSWEITEFLRKKEIKHVQKALD